MQTKSASLVTASCGAVKSGFGAAVSERRVLSWYTAVRIFDRLGYADRLSFSEAPLTLSIYFTGDEVTSAGPPAFLTSAARGLRGHFDSRSSLAPRWHRPLPMRSRPLEVFSGTSSRRKLRVAAASCLWQETASPSAEDPRSRERRSRRTACGGGRLRLCTSVYRHGSARGIRSYI